MQPLTPYFSIISTLAKLRNMSFTTMAKQIITLGVGAASVNYAVPVDEEPIDFQRWPFLNGFTGVPHVKLSGAFLLTAS